MYLGLLLVIVAVFCVVAGVLSGGAFTIVLVPVAVIALVAALTTAGSARLAGFRQTMARHPGKQASGGVPVGTPPPDGGEVPVTPDEYVEARQKSQ